MTSHFTRSGFGRSQQRAKDRLPLRNRIRNVLLGEILEDRCLMTATLGQDLWEVAAPDPNRVPAMRATNVGTFSLSEAQLRETLSKAPLEFTEEASRSQVVLSIPKPDGTLESFAIVNSPIMDAELAAQFPEIQTYAGQGIDDPGAKIRLDLTPAGFHAQVLSPNGAYYIDPYYHLDDSLYGSYYVAGQFRPAIDLMEPVIHSSITTLASQPASESDLFGEGPSNNNPGTQSRTGTQLRIYRAAVAASGEYTIFHGGTVALGQAAIVTAMNRVSGIYESELSIRMRLVANNSLLVYTDPNTDPYSNFNPGALLTENQANVDRIIRSNNYDIGHVFTTGGGGVAGLGVVGIDGLKAFGVTGLPAPINDAFYVDYVAHEIGHQFGGNHTFNGRAGACGPSRNPSTAYEPGSGTTIQAYAGICSTDDVQPNSDPYFHSVSLDEMLRHVDNVIPTVGIRTVTGNNVPTVSAGSTYTIPARTPFRLTATGLDDDASDQLTYSWEQRDLGPATNLNAPDNGIGPLFRAITPTTSPTRYFPRLSSVVNQTTSIGEQLPTTNRNLNFRVTVRDNRAAGGGVNTDDTRLTVVDTGTAFRVTAPAAATTWNALTFRDVRWDVAATNTGAINARTVSIYFSADGGATFPTLVASRVPNDGLETIVVPNIGTSTGRLMVAADDNVFFNVNIGSITVIPVPLQFVLEPGAAVYTENSAPIAISPSAQVIDPSGTNFAGLTLSATIAQNGEAADQLSILSVGDATGQVGVTGTQVRYGGIVVGALAQPNPSTIAITLNGSATAAAVEAITRSVAYSSSSDSPSPLPRGFVASLVAGLSSNRSIQIIQLNDSPSMRNSSLPTIDEDVQTPVGRAADLVLGANFIDPDANSRLGGIAVVTNPDVPGEGVWHFSTDQGGTWTTIGVVDDNTNSLLLSPTTLIGFLPAPNYFGTPTPLRVRVIDNTFVGVFSSSVGGLRRYLNPAARFTDGPVSPTIGSIGATVRNINDPPVAGVPLLSIAATQDQPVNFRFPPNTFIDIDSPTLTFVLQPVGAPTIPSWLQFNPTTQTITGVPRNEDVGSYDFVVRATDDAGAFANLPLTLTVANVNDPPEQLDLRGRTVAENDIGARIGNVSVFDPDFNDIVTLSVSDPRFVIRDGVLFLQANSFINFETESKVTVTITARDNGAPSRSTSIPFEITISDVNEFYPELTPQSFTIPFTRPDNLLLGRVTAPDRDTQQTVKFRIQQDDAGIFTVGESSGEVRLRSGAVVNQTKYSLFIMAFDDGTPVNSRVVQFNVDVEVPNSFAPVILLGQQFTIPENAIGGTKLGKVFAQDADGDTSFQFTTTGANGVFSINLTTGELALNPGNRLNFEAIRSYVVPIQVTDSGKPARTGSGNVTVTVTNTNDPPTAISVSNAKVPVQQKGFVLPALTVTDEDPAIQYTFSTNDPRFEVRNNRLALRTDVALPASAAGTISSVDVRVTDASDPTSFAVLPLAFSIVANPTPWQNPLNRFDVNRDGNVTSSDVLFLISSLGTSLRGPLSVPRELSQLSLNDVDVSGDNQLTSVDVLQLLSALNSQGVGSGEGEAAQLTGLPDPSTWLQAFDSLENDKRRGKSSR